MNVQATDEGTLFTQQEQTKTKASKIRPRRFYTKEAAGDVFDTVEWELRDATIKNAKSEVVFEQKQVEFPKTWSQLATNVTVEKYFRGKLDSPEREQSLRQVIHRVAETIRQWGVDQGYFDARDSKVFYDELAYILLHQRAAFNSPVWFNVGIEKQPQVSACFIQSVDDNMESIMNLAKAEVMLFKYGSGTGSNLSALRSSKEHLNGGGRSSGPVSFMKGFDSFAGVIKSGGKTRRAAKMVILNIDHPDILEFVKCKAEEERKAHALIDAGWDGNFSAAGGAYESIQYQNANNSVRMTDTFMKAVVDDREWYTKMVTTGEKCETFRARDLFREIAKAAHFCGDPGLQFDDTINAWNTCSNSGRINASNPCSEYLHLDDSACNLASINLRKFIRKPNGKPGWFDVEGFTHTVELMITAQDIMVKPASYPTEKIGEGARAYRQLGLGYANLGALLMSRGLGYDSDEGRAFASAITSLMQATAYRQSVELAQELGPYDGYKTNVEPQLRVIRKHEEAHEKLLEASKTDDKTLSTVLAAGFTMWKAAGLNAKEHGVRNAQVSVLAPTGTIGFLMDCDTTGIEPELALVKYKNLVGGGQLKLTNRATEEALTNLGYDQKEVEKIKACIEETGTIENCSTLKAEHLPVFDCSFRPASGKRSIKPMGHIRMMAAVQPFLSGAISKTVNVDNETTVEEIEKMYLDSWKLGLKSVAIYRDGCKRTQPLSTSKSVTGAARTVEPVAPTRRRLPDERMAVCHKFSIAGHDGYIHVGLHEDGTPGELFVRMAKEGSTIAGLMDGFAQAVSIALQHGVPLRIFIDKFSNMRFEPSGLTKTEDVRMAKSVLDYIFRWMEIRFVKNKPAFVTAKLSPGLEKPSALQAINVQEMPAPSKEIFINELDAPTCPDCGNITVRSGACHKCMECGSSLGCS